jgi:branched-chain amino acid transport system permease protein
MTDTALPIPANVDASDLLRARARWRIVEAAFWLACIAIYIALPSKWLIINEIAILGLFALSLDLVLGYAGIVSLGHAAFFGVGGYAAGLFAVHVNPDPILGLGVAGAAATILGFLTSFLVLRGSDLTRLMITLGIALMLGELANKLNWLTGGADGLQGITMGPVLGTWDFDIYGRVACAYSMVVLAILFAATRQIVYSPFGLSITAIRDNPLRAAAVGIPVNRRLVAVYTYAACLAGIAGGLLAQTTQFVGLDVLAFHRSADVMLVVVIGGAGYLYGGLIGAIGFKLLQDWLSAMTPQYWHFWIGLILVALVLLGRERPQRWLAHLTRKLSRRPRTTAGVQP